MLPLVKVKQSSDAGRDGHELRDLGLASRVLGLQAISPPDNFCVYSLWVLTPDDPHNLRWAQTMQSQMFNNGLLN